VGFWGGLTTLPCIGKVVGILSPVQLDLSTFSIETSQLLEWKKRVSSKKKLHDLLSKTGIF